MHSLTFRHFFLVCEFGNTEICIHLLKFSGFNAFIGLFWFLIIRVIFCSRFYTIFFSVTMDDNGTISDSESSLDSKGLSSAERQYLDMVEKGALDSLQNLSSSSSSSRRHLKILFHIWYHFFNVTLFFIHPFCRRHNLRWACVVSQVPSQTSVGTSHHCFVFQLSCNERVFIPQCVLTPPKLSDCNSFIDSPFTIIPITYLFLFPIWACHQFVVWETSTSFMVEIRILSSLLLLWCVSFLRKVEK